MSSVYNPGTIANGLKDLQFNEADEYRDSVTNQLNGCSPLLNSETADIETGCKGNYFPNAWTSGKGKEDEIYSNAFVKINETKNIFQKLSAVFKIGEKTIGVLTNLLIVIVITALGAVTVGLLMSYIVLPQSRKPTVNNTTVQLGLNVPNLETNGHQGPNKRSMYYKDANEIKSTVTEVTIKSVIQLHEITEDVNVVKVIRLTTAFSSNVIPTYAASFVKELHLTGPISKPWLKYLLSSFKQLETIILDVDKTCEGFAEKTDMPNQETVSLRNLEKLVIRNSYNCPIIKWGFNLELPSLKIIELSNVILNVKFYEIFENFLKKVGNTIEGIDISKSYICDECDITEMEFENLRYLKITKRLDKDPRYVFEAK